MALGEPELEQVIRQELSDGEKLLWAGRPDPAQAARKYIAITVFGCVWTLFISVFLVITQKMLHQATGSGGGAGVDQMFRLVFTLGPGLFLLVGLGMIASPAWGYARARRTIYAVTSQRLMIVTTGNTRSVVTFDERDLHQIHRTERADGTGSIVFALESYRDSNGQTATRAHGFWGIPHVKHVEMLIRQNILREKSGSV